MALTEPKPRVLFLHCLAIVLPTLEAKALVETRNLAILHHIKPVCSQVPLDLVFDFVRNQVARLVFEEKA
jgi:hypothetical protein